MRSLRVFGRLLLVAVIALAVLIAGAITVPVSQATDPRTFVALKADVPSVPEGTPLEITLGVGADRTQNVRNGDDFEAVGTPDATGMITVTDPDGELVAIGVAPKIPEIESPLRPLNDQSSAIGLVFSMPGFAGFTVLEDAMLVDAAYSVPELEEAAAAIARQRAAGTNPLVEPSTETLVAVMNLFNAADREIAARLDQLLAEIQPATAEVTPSGGIATVPTVAMHANGGSRAPTIVSAADIQGLPQACEDGLDDPSVCGNDRPERPCEVRYPGVVIDLDGRDGDAVCVVAHSFDPAANTVDLSGTNFLARWSLVYQASNTSLLPDAMLAPKRWSLPSVEEFLVDAAEFGLETWADGLRENLPGADLIARTLFRQAELEGTATERFAQRVREMIRQYITLPTSDFALSVGKPGDAPEGTRFTTFAFGWPRDSMSSQADRWLLSLSMTAITEWVIPGIRVALDIKKSSGSTGICRPFSNYSTKEAETLNEKRMDICTAILDLSAVLVPTLADVLARQNDPEVGDYLAIAGEVLSTIFTIFQDRIDPKLDGYLNKIRVGEVEVARELFQVVVVEKADINQPGSTASDEITERAVDGAGAAIAEGSGAGDPAELVEAAIIGIVTFALGSTDLGDITVLVLTQVLERAMAALIPAAGTAKALITATNTIIATVNILGGVAEVLAKGASTDTQDTYIITVAGLDSLPLSPGAMPAGGTPVARGETGATILVMDVSGSMADPASTEEGYDDSPKMDAARDAALALTSVAAIGGASGVSQSVGLVAFSDSASTLALPTQDTATVDARIEGLYPTNGTDIESGLEAALDALSGVGGLRRIVLLSDGADSVDATGAHILAGSVERARSEGIPIDTIAFDLQDTTASGLMAQIAEQTGGMFGEAAGASELARLVIRSQHAATGDIIEESIRPMTGTSTSVRLEVPNEGGVGPAEMLVTVVLRGEKFTVDLLDANGAPLDSSDTEVSTNGESTSITVYNPPPGTLTLVVTRIGAVADSDAGDANPVLLDEATGRFVSASNVKSTAAPAAVRAEESIPLNLVVVASVSGTAESRAVAVPEPRQQVAAIVAVAMWVLLLLTLAVVVAVRMRRRLV